MARTKRDVVHSLSIKLYEPEASALRSIRAHLIKHNLHFNPTISDAIRAVILHYHDTLIKKENHGTRP